MNNFSIYNGRELIYMIKLVDNSYLAGGSDFLSDWAWLAQGGVLRFNATTVEKMDSSRREVQWKAKSYLYPRLGEPNLHCQLIPKETRQNDCYSSIRQQGRDCSVYRVKTSG